MDYVTGKMPEDEILRKVQEKYRLSLEEAREYMQKMDEERRGFVEYPWRNFLTVQGAG